MKKIKKDSSQFIWKSSFPNLNLNYYAFQVFKTKKNRKNFVKRIKKFKKNENFESSSFEFIELISKPGGSWLLDFFCCFIWFITAYYDYFCMTLGHPSFSNLYHILCIYWRLPVHLALDWRELVYWYDQMEFLIMMAVGSQLRLNLLWIRRVELGVWTSEWL